MRVNFILFYFLVFTEIVNVTVVRDLRIRRYRYLYFNGYTYYRRLVYSFYYYTVLDGLYVILWCIIIYYI